MTTYAPCPACCTAWAGAVSSPDCPVCAGEARVRLSDPAVKEYGAETVSAALWLGLARAARAAVTDHPDDVAGGERKAYLTACVARFHAANVLGEARGWGGAGVAWRHKQDSWEKRRPSAEQLADMVQGGGLRYGDGVQLMAAHDPYPRGARPAAAGVVPDRSEHGHPSVLARVADPLRMDVDHTKRCGEWARAWRTADVIDRAVVEMTRHVVSPAYGGDIVGGEVA